MSCQLRVCVGSGTKRPVQCPPYDYRPTIHTVASVTLLYAVLAGGV